MDDEIEVIGVVDSNKSFESRKQHQIIKNEKPTSEELLADQLCDELRTKLMHCDSYWIRKSSLLTAEASRKISVPKLKLLELELGIHYRVVDEIVSAVKYLHKNYKHDETFRRRVEELNSLIEENKGTPFANELISKVEPSLFLEPLLVSAQTSVSKLQALITLAKTVGMRQVSKKLYDLYTQIRIEQLENDSTQIVGYDIIWFHLNTLLCDGDLCGLDPDNALIIYEAMVNLCMADARGLLNDDFYSVNDMLGFSRISPRNNWRACLRLLSEILYFRYITKPSDMIRTLKHNFESLSMLQVSQKLSDGLTPEDEEISKFLLSYAIGMKSYYEGNSYVVFVPARTFEISKRSIRNYWVHNTESKVEADDGELDFKNTLGANTDQYLEALTIACNVYMAYKKLNFGPETEIEPNLRSLLQKLQSSSPFVLIAQSVLVAGRYMDAAKFIQLAIRTTKDKNEQTVLMLQLLEANVAMRKTKMSLTYAMDLLNEAALVEKSVEDAIGVLLNQRFEDDTFIQIPTDGIYHYVALLLMNIAVVAYTKWETKGNAEMMNLAATIIVLCVQCCWPFCSDMLRNVFELLDRETTILNAIKMISNCVLFTMIFDTGVRFMEGSEVLKPADALNRFRKERSNRVIGRYTPFQDLVLYINSHNVSQNNTSLMQVLFS